MQDAQIGLYDMVLSTTLESNKSLRLSFMTRNHIGFVALHFV